jgi:hypothetical protein
MSNDREPYYEGEGCEEWETEQILKHQRIAFRERLASKFRAVCDEALHRQADAHGPSAKMSDASHELLRRTGKCMVNGHIIPLHGDSL